MTIPAAVGLIVIAGLLGVASYQSPAQASRPSEPRPGTAQAVSVEQPWATLDFAGSNDSGNLEIGQPLELSMTLGGMAEATTPFVAICESAHFESQIVPLTPDPRLPVMKATTTLAPIAHNRLSPGPHVSRLHVTFARSTETKFERVMTRIVYLTLGDTKPGRDEPASPTPKPDVPSEDDLAAGQTEPVLDAIPLSSDQLMEEDLLPFRSAQPTPAYWRQVRDLLNQGWSRATGNLPASLAHQTVQVQFRLYPGGRAQLLQIADESGSSEIDQAGIQAITESQPFPPFPLGVGKEPIDIHVRLQTGSKAGIQDFRTGTLRQPERTSNASKH
jgi:hypothetical protein